MQLEKQFFLRSLLRDEVRVAPVEANWRIVVEGQSTARIGLWKENRVFAGLPWDRHNEGGIGKVFIRTIANDYRCLYTKRLVISFIQNDTELRLFCAPFLVFALFFYFGFKKKT